MIVNIFFKCQRYSPVRSAAVCVQIYKFRLFVSGNTSDVQTNNLRFNFSIVIDDFDSAKTSTNASTSKGSSSTMPEVSLYQPPRPYTRQSSDASIKKILVRGRNYICQYNSYIYLKKIFEQLLEKSFSIVTTETLEIKYFKSIEVTVMKMQSTCRLILS